MPCSDCSPSFTTLAKLKKYKLLSTSRSNQDPFTSKHELDDLVSHAEKELAKCEETIAKLHETIVAFKNVRQTLIQQIRLAKSLAAPIRKIPAEVLRLIFIQFVDDEWNWMEVERCSVPGFNLAAVCSRWRSIAVATPALWQKINISFPEADSQPQQWRPDLLELTRYLLELSTRSHLSIFIDLPDSAPEVVEVPEVLHLLCEQAERWESVSGRCFNNIVLDALAPIQGRLSSLHSFELLCPFMYSSALIGAIPTLNRMRLYTIDDTSTIIPWNQIRYLKIQESHVLAIVRSLARLTDLQSLEIIFLLRRRESYVLEPTRSDINHLGITISDAEDEEEMVLLFEALILPHLKFLSIKSRGGYKTHQGAIRWSTVQLPALISRSATLITSFTLEDTGMSSGDLITLLQSMPALTDLFLSEHPESTSLLDDTFLSSLHCHRDLPLAICLTSLSLITNEISTAAIRLFVDVIQSRWNPSSAEDEVACIKRVKLMLRKMSVDPGLYEPLLTLGERGLDVSIRGMSSDEKGQD